ncbi:type I-C CRISPR-associated protein Cas7/Csd2 [Christensenellaceae bacterium OttesenSCG-928-M15]|nr:type I-C CRISPR-associated protein Cas7/Csd2 [Christensenellaceae bacterium OttesenSCG-928-M15]
MSILQNKIDFAFIITVHNANPNGDPLNGNRPREDFEGYGEISDVCIKRKIRNRLQDMGKPIFVQSDDKREDSFSSLSERASGCEPLKKVKDKEKYASIACEQWMDVRSFGQVFAFKSTDKGVSVGVRGPVSIHPAFSVSPIDIASIQITKSVNSEPKAGGIKSSDTMGTKHRVPFGLYVCKGSINCQLAEKTGFTQGDADAIHEALCTLFENDLSSARPEGSMEVRAVYWWKHANKTGQYSSAAVHRSLQITEKVDIPKAFEDYEITLLPLEGLEPEIFRSV